jgi:radical SAM superfamily enzyme YgiQ (UPF0313 family)
MKDFLKSGTKCLIVQSEFSAFSYWNYIDICKLVGAKYPAAPLGLLTVAALLPQQWHFKLVDANVEPLLDEHMEWADIVCTGGMLPQQRSMLSLIDKAQHFGCPVVVGGPDPTSQPELYQDADYLVQGEGEVTIPMLIEDLGKGSISGNYWSEEKADMTRAVIPRFDLIRFRDYIQVGVQYSRGCPFNCEFCDIIELYGRKSRTKTSEQIIEELQTLYDLGYRGHIDFVDDNFIGNKKNVRRVLPDIQAWSEANNFPFYFSTESSINLAADRPLLKMMQDVDFRFVFIGIETPENDVLKLTNKTANIDIPIDIAVSTINSFGLIVNAGFIIGFDNETERTADNMITCIQESGICMAMLGTLYALPNTQLTRRLKMEGRLFEDGTTLRKAGTEIDQTTSGLNFDTTRPRTQVLKDYARVIQYIYNPKHYYERATYTALQLKPEYKYRPSFFKMIKLFITFLKLSLKVGFNGTTGQLYWKMVFTVLFKNPKAAEASINLAAMFIHFHKMSKFIIELADKEIDILEKSVKKEKIRV